MREERKELIVCDKDKRFGVYVHLYVHLFASSVAIEKK